MTCLVSCIQVRFPRLGPINIYFLKPCLQRLKKEDAIFTWYTDDGSPPLDLPVCGFVGEFCIETVYGKLIYRFSKYRLGQKFGNSYFVIFYFLLKP